MTHKEQLLDTIAVADTQAYAIIDERRDTHPADVLKLREVRELIMKAHRIVKTIED